MQLLLVLPRAFLGAIFPFSQFPVPGAPAVLDIKFNVRTPCGWSWQGRACSESSPVTDQ